MQTVEEQKRTKEGLRSYETCDCTILLGSSGVLSDERRFQSWERVGLRIKLFKKVV